MNNRMIVGWLAGGLLVAATLVGAVERLQAQDAGDGTVGAQARAIEGVWDVVNTIRDCQARTPLFSFFSMDSYIRGGSYIGESASEPELRATGLGRWRHEAGRDYSAAYRFFTYDPDGNPNGRLTVSAWIRVSADGMSFRAADTAVMTDLDGHVLVNVCGTREATRFQ